MSEQTLFEKLGVRYREKDGIFYPLITVEIKKEDADIGKIWSSMDGIHTVRISAEIQKSGAMWRVAQQSGRGK